MKKRLSMLAAVLCAVIMVGSLSVTAYAGGSDEYIEPTEQWEGLDPVAETPAPAIEPGEGFTEDGNLVTRDLLYDKHTNKQFITVQTSGGNTFYIVIDYDTPVNEEEEQYQTYFFSVVDEADLLAAAEAAGVELPACVCTVKCAAGDINTDCPVCAVNMSECVGTKAEPEPVDEPEPAEPDPEQKSNTGTLLLILAVALIGGGAGWYFKIYRPKHQRAEQPEENYGDELEDYDDTPPWDEDESTEDDA